MRSLGRKPIGTRNCAAWVKTLIALRKRTPSLRRGEYLQLLAEDGHYAFARILGEDKVLVALNATSRARQLEIPCAAMGWSEVQGGPKPGQP